MRPLLIAALAVLALSAAPVTAAEGCAVADATVRQDPTCAKADATASGSRRLPAKAERVRVAPAAAGQPDTLPLWLLPTAAAALAVVAVSLVTRRA